MFYAILGFAGMCLKLTLELKTYTGVVFSRPMNFVMTLHEKNSKRYLKTGSFMLFQIIFGDVFCSIKSNALCFSQEKRLAWDIACSWVCQKYIFSPVPLNTQRKCSSEERLLLQMSHKITVTSYLRMCSFIFPGHHSLLRNFYSMNTDL